MVTRQSRKNRNAIQTDAEKISDLQKRVDEMTGEFNQLKKLLSILISKELDSKVKTGVETEDIEIEKEGLECQ